MPSKIRSTPAAPALPNLQALEAFVTICEAGSMSLAAQRLGVTQSAVSQLVKALEDAHGVQLFDREVRPARPTRAGLALVDGAAELLAQARSLAEGLRASARRDYAQIRLGAVDSFAATLGPDLIRALSGSARQIQLWSGLSPGLSAQLQARELDLAICTDAALVEPRIRQRLLCSESWVAVFPKGHGARKPKAVRELQDIVGELPLIRYSQRSVIGQQIERFLLHVGIAAPRRFEFDATDPLLSLVAAGLGWALSTPLCLWQSRQYLDSVEVIPLPGVRLGQRDFFLLSRQGEATGLETEIVRITRRTIRLTTLPAIRRMMPGLPSGVLSCPDEK